MSAPASSSALSSYLFQRVKADIEFLRSQSLIDDGARNAINLQLDAAAARSGSMNGIGALSGQLSAVSVSTPSPQLRDPAPPLPPPTTNHPAQDTRDRAKALWNYAAT